MEQISHIYENTTFDMIIKANFRKYLDPIYYKKNHVIEMFRKLENDELTIYRVHEIIYSFTNYYFVEKILINRKERKYRSWVHTFLVIEECLISQDLLNVNYTQFFDINYFLKGKKRATFKKGCEIIEKIKMNLI